MAFATINARRSLIGFMRPGVAMQPVPTGAFDTAPERRLLAYGVAAVAVAGGAASLTLADLGVVATGAGGLLGRGAVALAPLGAVAFGAIGRVGVGSIALAPLGFVAAGTGPPPGPQTGTAFLFLDDVHCFALGRGPDIRPPWTIPEEGGRGTVRVVRRRRLTW